MLVEHLEDLGLKVDEANDGDIALEKVKIQKYDYICTDLKMPRMSGDKFIQEARKISNGDTKYFVISAGIKPMDSSDTPDPLREYITGYIDKPFDEELIYKALTKKRES